MTTFVVVGQLCKCQYVQWAFSPAGGFDCTSGYRRALLADPMQIIYFPTAYPKPDRRYHAVLLHPNLQFRRSEWFDLKPRLNRRHYAGEYEFTYDPQKLLAEYEPLHRRMDREYHDYDRRIKRSYAEQMIGDTVFIVFPRELCYRAHARILCAL